MTISSRLNDESVEQIKGTGYFGFSATKLENLLESEYTLVDIGADISSSVSSFKDDLEKCIQEIVRACYKSPKPDNLMIRLSEFNSNVNEVHGYKLLQNCNVDDYIGLLSPGGMTALFEAIYKAIDANVAYAESLVSNNYIVNGVIYIMTDGMENASARTVNDILNVKKEALKKEKIESLTTILIGVNTQESDIRQYLEDFKNSAQFDAYVDVPEATPQKLAKLAEWVSKSISSSSTSLGSGSAAPVQSLTI